jgi:hypothetical protein
MESSYGFGETFASLTVVDTTDSAILSELAANVSLRGTLTFEADKVRERRSELRVLYTATHIKAFFIEALKAFAANPDKGFDYLAVTRHGRGGLTRRSFF